MIINKLKLKGKFQEKQDKLKRKFEKSQLESLLQDEEKEIYNYSKQQGIQQLDQAPIQGKGRILTSGKTVHGQETYFMQELTTGDKIIVFNQTTLGKESREITLVLSDKSMQIKDPFDQDLITYTNFEIQKKTQIIEQEECLEQQFMKKIDILKKGIQKPKQNYEIRLKKSGMWGYQTIKEKVDQDSTHENLLDIRSKKIRDRHCWI